MTDKAVLRATFGPKGSGSMCASFRERKEEQRLSCPAKLSFKTREQVVTLKQAETQWIRQLHALLGTMT